MGCRASKNDVHENGKAKKDPAEAMEDPAEPFLKMLRVGVPREAVLERARAANVSDSVYRKIEGAIFRCDNAFLESCKFTTDDLREEVRDEEKRSMMEKYNQLLANLQSVPYAFPTVDNRFPVLVSRGKISANVVVAFADETRPVVLERVSELYEDFLKLQMIKLPIFRRICKNNSLLIFPFLKLSMLK